ncbi:MAG TPA: hypothetical protein PKW49_07850 [Paludibacteraceae bacterium]|nr:hypothetical protein [Paludibacteraceae bacterium]HQF50343.1 hypothetical protein [Paludibacteraceae bacterium]HQJ90430.1 hypothetical protein [Paludibacteraceae bacterium]
MRQGKLTDIIAPSAQNIIFSTLLACVLWYDLFFPSLNTTEGEVSASGDSPLFSLISSSLLVCSIWGKIISFALFMLINFILLHFNEVFSFIRVRTVLPLLFFIIIGSLLVQPHCLSAGMIVSFIFLLALYSGFFYVNKGHPIHTFNVGILLSIASLFSFSYITYVIPFFVFVYSCSMLNMRSFLAMMMGIVLPYVYAFMFYFFWLRQPEALIGYITNSFTFSAYQFDYSILSIIYTSFLGILALVSILYFFLGDLQDNIKPRKEFSNLIIVFLWTFVLFSLNLTGSETLLYTLIMLLSIILGRHFSLNVSKFTRIALILFSISSVIILFFR